MANVRDPDKVKMNPKDTEQNSEVASPVNLKQISTEATNQPKQRKAYKRKRAKIKRSKSHVNKQDRSVTKDKLEAKGESSDEDIAKLKEMVQRKGKTRRRVIMVDWDKTPFVFSDKGAKGQLAHKRAPRLVMCKQIATIVEAEEREPVETRPYKGRHCTYINRIIIHVLKK